MKVNEFQAGMSFNGPLLISGMHEGATGSGAMYLSMDLQDSTGTIDAKYWDVKPAQRALCEPGRVVEVDGRIIDYKGHLQMKVLSVKPNKGDINPKDFQESAPVDTDELHAFIEKEINSLKRPSLQAVVRDLYTQAGEEFYVHPAATKNHHEYKGGLAAHVAGMLKLAEAILPLYPVLNRDILIAGILVHDIGKVEEISGGVVNEYTTRGKLLGHISIGFCRIDESARRLGYGDDEYILVLEHLVLSHHGEYEFGSPVLPETPEAEALHFIDNLDARMEILRKAMKQTKPGTFSSRIYPMENRMFYKVSDEED